MSVMKLDACATEEQRIATCSLLNRVVLNETKLETELLRDIETLQSPLHGRLSPAQRVRT